MNMIITKKKKWILAMIALFLVFTCVILPILVAPSSPMKAAEGEDGFAEGSQVYVPETPSGDGGELAIKAAGILSAGIGDGWDMSNYITAVVIKDSQNNIINTGNFYYGEPYKFSISFAE